VTIIKNGFGNKLLMLFIAIRIFKLHSRKNDILHVIVRRSKHEKCIVTEDLRYIFPKLGQITWLRWIDSWEEYDSLKKTGIEIPASYDFDIIPVLTGLKTAFTMNTDYKPLLKQYDMENGIFIHYRLGDKMKMMDQYIIMKPSYFADYVIEFLHKKKGPIYLLSDSPNIARQLLPFATLLDLDWVSTFYLMTKCKRGIFSESTFGIAAAFLNHEEPTIIYPAYYKDISQKKSGIIERKNLGTVFTYEYNQKYIANRSDLQL
jgi:hypothetical protein